MSSENPIWFWNWVKLKYIMGICGFSCHSLLKTFKSIQHKTTFSFYHSIFVSFNFFLSHIELDFYIIFISYKCVPNEFSLKIVILFEQFLYIYDSFLNKSLHWIYLPTVNSLKVSGYNTQSKNITLLINLRSFCFFSLLLFLLLGYNFYFNICLPVGFSVDHQPNSASTLYEVFVKKPKITS